MNLRTKLILLVSILLALCSNAQNDTIQKYPKILNYMGDTVIVFAFKQGIELSDRNEQRKECVERNKNLEQIIIEKDVIINSQLDKIVNKDIIISKNKENEEAQEELLDICEGEKKTLDKEVKKQKRGKIVAIIGIGVVAILGLIF